MRTVVALFETRSEARRTIEDLKRIGVRETDVSMISADGASGPIATFLDPARVSREDGGILNALIRMGLSESEARKYIAGVEQGYTLETVAIDDAKAAEALEIMRLHAAGTSDADRTKDRHETGTKNDAVPLGGEEANVARTAGVIEEIDIEEVVLQPQSERGRFE